MTGVKKLYGYNFNNNMLRITYLNEMSEDRAQGDLVGAVVSATVVAIIAILGIYLFSEFNQTITVAGPLSGTGEDLLRNTADALVLAVGGAGIAVTAILLFRGAGR